MECKKQKPFEPGMYVSYVPGFGKPENGRIKSISGNHIFVVYNCNDEWEHYKDYTGVNTPREELQHGWRDKDGISIKTPEDKADIKRCHHHYLPTNAKWQSVTQRECCHCGHIID